MIQIPEQLRFFDDMGDARVQGAVDVFREHISREHFDSQEVLRAILHIGVSGALAAYDRHREITETEARQFVEHFVGQMTETIRGSWDALDAAVQQRKGRRRP